MASSLARRAAASVATLLVLGFAASLLVGGAAAAEATLQLSPSVVPGTVPPGGTGTVAIELKNVGVVAANRVESWLVEADDAFVVAPATTVAIGPLAASASTAVSPFSFRVPASTEPGVYHALFQLQYWWVYGSTQTAQFTYTVTLTVRALEGLLVEGLEPAVLELGVDTPAVIGLVNLGPTAFTHVQGAWTSASGAVLPVGSTNTFFVMVLGPGERIGVPVVLSAKPDATPGLDSLSFSVDYLDAAGNPLEASAVLGLRIADPEGSDLVVSVQDVDADEVTFAVTNVGLRPVTGVQVRVLAAPGLRITEADTMALGNLAAGEFALAKFGVQRTEGAPRVVEAAVAASYTDASGHRWTMPHEVRIAGLEAEGGGTGWLVTGVVLAVLGIQGIVLLVVWQRRRRRAERAALAKVKDAEWDKLGLT